MIKKIIATTGEDTANIVVSTRIAYIDKEIWDTVWTLTEKENKTLRLESKPIGTYLYLGEMASYIEDHKSK